MLIRPATDADASSLTTLRWRSKSFWGYSEEWIRAAEGEVSVPLPGTAATLLMFVLDEGGHLLGFYSLLRHSPQTAELDDFFLDLPSIGKGLGKRLWDHAVQQAQSLGHHELIIIADPNAAAFYEKQGATRIGGITSSADPNRSLPRLRFSLREP